MQELLKEAQQKIKNQNYFIGNVENKALDDAGIDEKVLEGTIDEFKNCERPQDVVRYKKNLRALANLYIKGYDLTAGIYYIKTNRNRKYRCLRILLLRNVIGCRQR